MFLGLRIGEWGARSCRLHRWVHWRRSPRWSPVLSSWNYLMRLALISVYINGFDIPILSSCLLDVVPFDKVCLFQEISSWLQFDQSVCWLRRHSWHYQSSYIETACCPGSCMSVDTVTHKVLCVWVRKSESKLVNIWPKSGKKIAANLWLGHCWVEKTGWK